MYNILLKDLTVGQVFHTKQGGSVTVIDIVDYRNILIQHNDSYKHTMVVKLQRLNKGDIRNPYFPTLLGKGFIGTGSYSSVSHKVAYKMWSAMLTRAYCSKTKERQITYLHVTVCHSWHNFQNFAEWLYSQDYFNEGFQLDKDILVNGNKEYSPDCCSLVPQEINKLFINKGGSNKELSVGVYYRKGTYSVKAGNKYVGNYPSLELAKEAYTTAKSVYVLSKVEEWKDRLDPKVLHRMRILATNPEEFANDL